MEFVHLQSLSDRERTLIVSDFLSDTLVSEDRLRMAAPRARRHVWGAIFALGAVAAIAVFAYATGLAADNDAAYRAHLEGGKLAYEFRPQALPVWLELVGALSVIAAFTGAIGFLRARKEGESDTLLLHHETSNVPANSNVPRDATRAVRVDASGAKVEIDASVTAYRRDAEGREMPLPPGSSSLHVAPGESAFLLEGARRIELYWAAPAKALPASSGVGAFDTRFASYVGSSALAMFVLLAFLRALQPDAHRLMSDSFADRLRPALTRMAPNEDEIVEPDQDGSDEGEAKGDKAAAELRGEAKADGDVERARLALRKTSDTPSISQEQATNYARSAGALGVIRQQDLIANFSGLALTTSGLEDYDSLGSDPNGAVGRQVGSAADTFGTTHFAMATDGVVRVGGPGTYFGGEGDCMADERCGGPGTLALKTRKHRDVPPEVGFGTPKTSSGDLDKAVIRRHIRKQMARIRHCYERRLVVKSSLAGTVNVQFTIGGKGGVLGSKAAGVGDNALESCVADVVASIQFPSTSSGGVVNVNYPFTFQPAG